MANHCPFLNRSDPRCSQHFGINHLGYAMRHCLGEYGLCEAYWVLRAERQDRRRATTLASGTFHGCTNQTNLAGHDQRLIPLTVSAGHAQRRPTAA